MAQAYFLNISTNVLGLSVKQRQVLSNDRYDTIYTTIHFNYDGIREWCTTNSKLTTTRVGSSYVDLKINFLQSLAWWSTNLTLRGKQIVLSDFDATMMADCIYEYKLDYEDGKKDPYIEKPYKFSHSKWVAWEEIMYTYSIAIKNI